MKEDLNQLEMALLDTKITNKKSSIIKLNRGSCDPTTCCCGCSCVAFVTTITGILGALGGLAYLIYYLVTTFQNNSSTPTLTTLP